MDLYLPTSEIGIKGISWNTGGVTEHHEIWVNSEGSAGNTWQLVATFDGQSACNPLSCPVPSQDTLRIDGPDGHKFNSRSIVEIDPICLQVITRNYYACALLTLNFPSTKIGSSIPQLHFLLGVILIY